VSAGGSLQLLDPRTTWLIEVRRVHARIAEYRGTSEEDSGIQVLLDRVYVQEGFTEQSVAAQVFAPAEVKRRGQILLAITATGDRVGMIICGSSQNPYRQVAANDEAEMQLLAVDPSARGHGLGRALCLKFENKARSLGFIKAVLSTQPSMHRAHRLYEDLGNRRNSVRDWVRGSRPFLVFEKSLNSSGATYAA
jgi:ribosomal protein S18 acetylase RimI-like enzyme